MKASLLVENTVPEFVCLFLVFLVGMFPRWQCLKQTLYMYVHVHRGAAHFLCQTPSLLHLERIFALWSWHTIQMCRLPSFFDAKTDVQQQPHVDGSGLGV